MSTGHSLSKVQLVNVQRLNLFEVVFECADWSSVPSFFLTTMWIKIIRKKLGSNAGLLVPQATTLTTRPRVLRHSCAFTSSVISQQSTSKLFNLITSISPVYFLKLRLKLIKQCRNYFETISRLSGKLFCASWFFCKNFFCRLLRNFGDFFQNVWSHWQSKTSASKSAESSLLGLEWAQKSRAFLWVIKIELLICRGKIK